MTSDFPMMNRLWSRRIPKRDIKGGGGGSHKGMIEGPFQCKFIKI